MATTHIGIMDPEGLQAIVRVPGGYNPDELDDAVRRCLGMYKQALSFRMAVGLYDHFEIDMEAEIEMPDGMTDE